MQFSKTTFVTLTLTAAIVGVATHKIARAQQTPPPATNTDTLKVTSQLTVVDVTVTDAKGKPVRGLTQSDFTLKEDGKPQPLRSFQQYGTEIPSSQPAPPALPANVYTNQQPPTPTTRAANILLVDALNTSPARRMYVRQQSMNYLKNMPAGTQVGIYDAEGKRLNILTQTLNITLKPEEIPRFTKTPLRYSQQLDLPPGKVFLRVGILDNTSEKIGTLEIPLTVTPK